MNTNAPLTLSSGRPDASYIWWVIRPSLNNPPDVYYYGYWVYDDLDTYIWFPADYVIVDSSWVEYVP
jgi:hypothetical protein